MTTRPTERQLAVLSHLVDGPQTGAAIGARQGVSRQRGHQLAQRVVSLGWALASGGVYRLSADGRRLYLASRAAQKSFDALVTVRR